MARIALISPLRTEEKHPWNPVAVSQRFLNFGVLSLASYLAKLGHESLVVDEYCINSRADGLSNTADFLVDRFGDSGPDVVGVSCISAYSADRARRVLKLVSGLWPSVPRLVGGQHFVGFWRERFGAYLPEANVLITGEAESATDAFLVALSKRGSVAAITPPDLPTNVYWRVGANVFRGDRRNTTHLPLDELSVADYTLYPGSDLLFPSLEFSRGCPYACVICANNGVNRRYYRRASAVALRVALEKLVTHRAERPLRFYMQASNFSVTLAEANEIAVELSSKGIEAKWRTEVRVDEMDPGVLPILAQVGLTVLDIGLESASASTLRIMRKARDPDIYLKRASNFLKAAHDAGVFTKVNYLIHPGDTHKSVSESIAWLGQHASYISAISAGVAVEFPGTPLSQAFPRYENMYGTKREPHPLSKWGVFRLRPSFDLGSTEASEIAIKIAQRLQTRRAFAASKSFGYFDADVGEDGVFAKLPVASEITPYREDDF